VATLRLPELGGWSAVVKVAPVPVCAPSACTATAIHEWLPDRVILTLPPAPQPAVVRLAIWHDTTVGAAIGWAPVPLYCWRTSVRWLRALPAAATAQRKRQTIMILWVTL
jgi:hypothetical protein